MHLLPDPHILALTGTGLLIALVARLPLETGEAPLASVSLINDGSLPARAQTPSTEAAYRTACTGQERAS